MGDCKACRGKGTMRGYDGKRERFTVPVDPRPTSRFMERVLRQLLHTRFGECITYGELAEAAGAPGSAQAVGNVMAHNPIPIVIPCHRVLPADRSLGHFTGGTDMKRFLLRLEGVELESERQRTLFDD